MRYVQVDGDRVTGKLSTTGSIDPTRLPPNRRFVQFPDGVGLPPTGSTLVVTGDKGDPIIVFEQGAVRFDAPVPPPPAVDRLQTIIDKQAEILAEIKKGTGALEARPVP